MEIVLTREDLARLTETARDEILGLALGRKALEHAAAAEPPLADYATDARYVGIDMTDVVDLGFRKMQKWMTAASAQTKAGLYVFAARGPVVTADTLVKAGIPNLPHFQSRTTIRTRTITGDRDSYLLGWDDWSRVDDGEGRYAVTPTTYRSLRRYFGLS